MPEDLLRELRDWSARLRRAELNGWAQTADMCRRRIDNCLDRAHTEQKVA